MPDRFDLLKLDFFWTQPLLENVKKTGLAYAPVCEVDIGDIVDVGFARGIVVDKVSFCDKDDKFVKLIVGLVPISSVVYKMQRMKYEDDLD